MRTDQNIRQALGMSQEAFAALLKVSESLVSLEELDLRTYPTNALLKANALEQAFVQAEPEIPVPENETYVSMLLAKMGHEVYFQKEATKQKRVLEKKLRKARNRIFNLNLERKKLFEKFQQMWKAMLFLENHLPTVTDAHDQKILENALYFNTWNAEKTGIRLMGIDSDLVRLQSEEKALVLGLEKLGLP